MFQNRILKASVTPSDEISSGIITQHGALEGDGAAEAALDHRPVNFKRIVSEAEQEQPARHQGKRQRDQAEKHPLVVGQLRPFDNANEGSFFSPVPAVRSQSRRLHLLHHGSGHHQADVFLSRRARVHYPEIRPLQSTRIRSESSRSTSRSSPIKMTATCRCFCSLSRS